MFDSCYFLRLLPRLMMMIGKHLSLHHFTLITLARVWCVAKVRAVNFQHTYWILCHRFAPLFHVISTIGRPTALLPGSVLLRVGVATWEQRRFACRLVPALCLVLRIIRGCLYFGPWTGHGESFLSFSHEIISAYKVFQIMYFNYARVFFIFSQNSTMEVASWAILIAILCIPELIFVVHMISEHWVSLSVWLSSLPLTMF